MFDNNERVWMMQGDCLELMKEIPSGSVDMVLADPPYGTTACKWDSVIPLDKMWEQLKRYESKKDIRDKDGIQQPTVEVLMTPC